ncbi:glycosyltransferase [Haloarculaceae archaeon H-GB11]|nr:glycosyltransferase [Haloarculaceae archaeon H-GB11]
MGHAALFLPSLRGGGAERVMVSIANELAARGHTIDLLPASPEGTYRQDVSDRVSLVDLGAFDVLPTETIPALPGLVRYLRRQNPTTLLSTMDNANVVALLARNLSGVDTRVVIRLSNVMKPQSRSSLKGQALDFLVSKTYPDADAIVAVSTDVQTDVESTVGVSADKTNVILNPVDIETINRQKAKSLDEPWFDDDVPVVLGVGRLNEQKQFRTLVSAVANVSADRDCRLVVLGSGPKRKELVSLAEQLDIENIVRLPGFVENPYVYMAEADVFALPSAWEGCPNVLLEALACGTPVVATDCPGGSAEILADGKYGLLTPVGDVAKMSDAIHNALDHQIDESVLVDRASEFSTTRVVDRYEELIFK